MTASITLVSRAGLLASTSISAPPTWQKDYPVARQQGLQGGPPPLVVAAADARGWSNLTRDGALPEEARKTQSDNCVYLYFSNRSVQHPAFRHSAKINPEELAGRLTRYSSRDHLVSSTETVALPVPAGNVDFGGCPNCRCY